MTTKKDKLSEQVRAAINDCGVTRYRISKDTGISQVTLMEFFHGRRGLRLSALDILADYLDLRIARGPGFPPAAAGQAQGKGQDRTVRKTPGKTRTRQTDGKTKR